MNFEIVTNSPEETLAFGRDLSKALGYGRIIALESELGGGKTVLTKGIAAGLGVGDPDLVTSPTFTLVNCYFGNEGEIYHVDLYRLTSSSEAVEIGIEELLNSGRTVIIEWAERIRELLCDDAVTVCIETLDTK
jgi:tRNA threonylcarbamoyladenosine biosynthesis protein TsaE